MRQPVSNKVRRGHSRRQSLGDFANGFILELAELAIDLALESRGLLPQVRPEYTIAESGKPEEKVDEVDPGGDLHDADAGAFVVGPALALEEDAGEDAEGDEPEAGQDRVPDERPVDRDKGDREDDARDTGHAGHHCCEHPGRGLRVARLAVLVHPVSVEANDDQGEDQLDAACGPARDVLVEADLLGGGAFADSGNDLAGGEETHRG